VVTATEDGGERILLAMEFCGALPAGNNAWQRHGRALSFGQAGVPYLIYNEVGGLELNSDRSPKSARFPNPAVPISLVQFSRDIGVPVLPVYEAAASALPDSVAPFSEVLGRTAAAALIRALVFGLDSRAAIADLEYRALEMGLLLADRDRHSRGYSRPQWVEALSEASLSDHYLRTGVGWTRRSGEKVRISATAQELITSLPDLRPFAVGSKLLPFFLVDKDQTANLAGVLDRVYGPRARIVTAWIEELETPVAIVLVTGFKPRGDDSRPDRGLAPLARMLVGDHVGVLTIVWGPAKSAMIGRIRNDPAAAADSNGLLQSVFSASDMAIFDSVESEPVVVDSRPFAAARASDAALLIGSRHNPPIGEHDVDSIFHFLTTQPGRANVVEGMCNPPGGDWSGINLQLGELVARWTSLPRLSAAKRPDHVVQLILDSGPIVLSVESKRVFRDLEPNVGPRLIEYMTALMNIGPGIVMNHLSNRWEPTPDELHAAFDFPVYSLAIAAVTGYPIGTTLDTVREQYDLDFIATISVGQRNIPTLTFASRPGLKSLFVQILATLADGSALGLEVRED
jgi:hypothetical protein